MVGLRALGGDASDRIFQVVRDFLEDKSSLKSKPEWAFYDLMMWEKKCGMLLDGIA
uniref:Uncharacterized protein n=1 Tax=Nelumbo nucifera TaxID=4432 RepID=A0A822XZ68_NELNU|nr:TPA_asm: hypothetical protein HUJ06_025558 [Nelumbo nucifera]